MSNSGKELLELSELPNGWTVVPLETLVREGLIGLVRSQKEQSVHEGHPYIRMQHYDLKGNWNFSDLTKILVSLEELKRYELKKGDVLFNTRNSYELVGKVAIWDLDRPGYLYNNNILRLRFFNCIVPKLVGYQMMSPQFRKRLALSKSATTSVCAIYGKDLYCQPLLLPPLNEQYRIVTKIEALKARSQRVKEELEAIPALLNQFRQSVLAAAFRGDLTADWREKSPDVEPASVLLERIRAERRSRWEEAELEKMKAQGKTTKDDKWKEKYEEPESINAENLQELPMGWSWTNIDNLSFVVRGASPRPAGDPKYFGGDTPWITVAEITKDENIYLTSTSGFVTKEGKKASRFIETGSLLLSNSGATLGVPKITQIGGCINDGSVALLFVTGQVQLYLYYFLKSLTQKLRKINQGAAQPNLNTTIVRNIMVPLPPYKEQKVIIDRLKHQLSTASKIETLIIKNLEITETLNQSILAKAFRGELVPQDPNNEPASILLERIRAEREKLDTKKKAKGKSEKKSHKAKPEAVEPEQLSLPGFE